MIHLLARFGFMVFCVLFMFSCGDAPVSDEAKSSQNETVSEEKIEEEEKTITVHGTILDHQGEPVNIVSVRPSHGASVTSARGSYSIILPYGGEVSLTFSHNDYITTTKKIKATKDQLLDIRLIPQGKGLGVVEGFVTNQNGIPIVSAIVRIESNTVTTDDTGWYFVAGVSSGNQTINVSKGCGQYAIYSKEIFIKDIAVTTHLPILTQVEIEITLTVTHTKIRKGDFLVLRASIEGKTSSFEWSSDKEGILATILNASVKFDIVGLHVITFTAKDSNDNIQYASLEIEVLPENNTPPSKVTKIKSTDESETSISLTWKKSEDSDGFIQNYYVSYKNHKSGNWSSEQTIAVPNYEWEHNVLTAYTIENLASNTTYTFRIRALDNDGEYSEPEESKAIATEASEEDLAEE